MRELARLVLNRPRFTTDSEQILIRRIIRGHAALVDFSWRSALLRRVVRRVFPAAIWKQPGAELGRHRHAQGPACESARKGLLRRGHSWTGGGWLFPSETTLETLSEEPSLNNVGFGQEVATRPGKERLEFGQWGVGHWLAASAWFGRRFHRDSCCYMYFQPVDAEKVYVAAVALVCAWERQCESPRPVGFLQLALRRHDRNLPLKAIKEAHAVACLSEWRVVASILFR
jgi:hypothetical protein